MAGVALLELEGRHGTIDWLQCQRALAWKRTNGDDPVVAEHDVADVHTVIHRIQHVFFRLAHNE